MTTMPLPPSRFCRMPSTTPTTSFVAPPAGCDVRVTLRLQPADDVRVHAPLELFGRGASFRDGRHPLHWCLLFCHGGQQIIFLFFPWFLTCNNFPHCYTKCIYIAFCFIVFVFLFLFTTKFFR